MGGQAGAPDLRHPLDIRAGAGEHPVAGVAGLDVHGQGGAQVGEAGMHFAADAAAVGAHLAVGGQQV